MFSRKFLKPWVLIILVVAAVLIAVVFLNRDSVTRKSSNSVWKIAAADTGRIEQLLRQARIARETNPDFAMLLFEQALNESVRTRYCDGAVHALLGLARREAEQGNFEQAYKYFMQAAPYADTPVYNRSLKAGYLGTFASHYYLLQGEYIKGNELYFKALDDLYSKKIYNSESIPKIYFNLSLTFTETRQFSKALKYLGLGEAVARRNNYTEALVQILTNYGRVYFLTDSFKQAENKFVEATKLLPLTKDQHTKVNLLMSIADFFIKSKAPSKAIPYLDQTLALSNSSKMTAVKVSALLLLANAYNELGWYKKAEDILRPAMDTVKQNGLVLSFAGGYEALYQSMKGQGRFEEALKYHELKVDLNQKLMDSAKTSAMSKMELKYRTAAKDHEIASKALMIVRQENKIFRKNILICGIFILFAVLLIVAYRTARNMRQRHSQQISSLQKEKHILSLQSHIDGEEKERKRIARELHDGIANMLSTLRIHLGALSVSAPNLSVEPNFTAAMELVDEAGREVRRTSNNLMPEVLLTLGLSEAIEQYCTHVMETSGIKLRVQSFGESKKFSYRLRLTVYRIVQELVHNIIKHSHATEAVIQLMLDIEVLTITVEDNGQGFNEEQQTSGLGLSNIRSRVESLHGEFYLQSSPENGTSIYIVIPVKSENFVSDENKNNNHR